MDIVKEFRSIKQHRINERIELDFNPNANMLIDPSDIINILSDIIRLNYLPENVYNIDFPKNISKELYLKILNDNRKSLSITPIFIMIIENPKEYGELKLSYTIIKNNMQCINVADAITIAEHVNFGTLSFLLALIFRYVIMAKNSHMTDYMTRNIVHKNTNLIKYWKYIGEDGVNFKKIKVDVDNPYYVEKSFKESPDMIGNTLAKNIRFLNNGILRCGVTGLITWEEKTSIE